MYGIKLDLLIQNLNLQLELEKGLCHRPELTYGIVDEPPALAPVVQLKASVSFVIAEVGGGSDPEMDQ